MKSRINVLPIPLALFFGSLLVIGITAGDYGVVWDEPAYFHASDLHIGWIKEAIASSFGNTHLPFEDKTITAAWHWNPYNVPHPPFSRIVSGLTNLAFDHVLDKFTAYRMGPALFFAALVTVMYIWMKELFGKAAAIFSALAVLLIPNLFAFAHIAVTDMPLASLWFITAYSFWKGLSKWQWSAGLGVLWGLALATKFPAVLILFPLVLWAQLFARNRYSNNIFSMLFVAPVVMVATQPYLWHATGLRLLQFFYEGISRGYRPETNFGVEFYGHTLLSSQLPWYYSFFMIGITTPEPFIVLALLGILSSTFRPEERSAVLLFVFNAIFVLSLGLMPGAVLHDGIRQLLSALPFLAALAGVGFHSLLQFCLQFARKTPGMVQVARIESKWAGILLVLICFSPLLDLCLSHPFQLSFYNRFVGGIRGAYSRGLETTYFMEAFTPKFLQALNEQLPRRAIINASVANFMFDFYQKQGCLRKDIEITDREANYYILLNRRTALRPNERRLIDAPTKPFLTVDLAGIPLVSVFHFREHIRMSNN